MFQQHFTGVIGADLGCSGVQSEAVLTEAIGWRPQF